MTSLERPANELFRGGFLNVNKPVGWTSTDVVRKLKGVTRSKKIGHGGTLDPIASGVLPICIGQATKFAEMFLLGDKEYRLTILLGEETDTYDSEGNVTRSAPFDHVGMALLEETVGSFVGQLRQVPPMFSAVRHEGRRLYQLARKGVEVERQARELTLYTASIVSFEAPRAVIDLRCSHGFYARSFAHDLGKALGTAAHVAGLIRTRSGKLAIDDSHTIEEIESLANENRWHEATLPIDFMLDHLPGFDLDPLKAEMVRHGRSLTAPELPLANGEKGDRIRVYEDGHLIALMRFDPRQFAWRPDKVLVSN